MARISALRLEDLAPDLRAFCLEREQSVGKNHNAMLTFARVPELVRPLYALLDRLIVDRHKQSLLEPRIRHLVLLRVPRLNGCRYCTGHQTRRRAEQGYSRAEIQALIDGPLDSPLFTEREKAALRFAEDVTKNVEPSIETFAEVRKHFTSEQIIELSAVVGIWCMWNRMVEVSKPDFDDDIYEKLVAAGVEDLLLPQSAEQAAAE